MSRPYHKVEPIRRNPDGVGYAYGINTIPGAPPEIATYLEDQFFLAVDTHAADALQHLLRHGPNMPNARLRDGWSRFIMSIIHRTPEKVEWFFRVWSAQFEEAVVSARLEEERLAKEAGLPYELKPVDLELRRGMSWARVVQSVVDDKNVGMLINGMQWGVLQLHEGFELLTSDRPVVMTNGIKGPDSHIVVPISPRKMFVAAHTRKKLEEINAMGAKSLARTCNEVVTSQAHRFVYGTDDSQLGFVANRLGKRPSQFIAPASLIRQFPRIDWPPGPLPPRPKKIKGARVRPADAPTSEGA
jgi:hypothetical protein